MSSHKRQQLYLDSERCCQRLFLPFQRVILYSTIYFDRVNCWTLYYRFERLDDEWQQKTDQRHIRATARGTFNIRELQSNEQINKNIVRVWWAELMRCATARSTIIIRHFHVHHVLYWYSHVSLEIAHSFHNTPFFRRVDRSACRLTKVARHQLYVARYAFLWSIFSHKVLL